jgi:hypothetical protein
MLVEAVPALRPLYQRHLDFHDGELLPHVWFGDLTRFVERAFSADGGQDRHDALMILGYLEDAMASGDPDVAELVSVSFLENLDSRRAGYQHIRAAMGPRLRKELALYEGT